MKLHELAPPEGAHRQKTRVGRGIGAGKGKTAGRGTKGQKARAGGSIPPWFEGGQTPLHMRIPKLRGFRNRAKVEYEIVNVGDIAARIDAGAFAGAGSAPKKGEPMTVNADILRAVGLVRDVKKPLKILGNGELSTALFVVADAFTKSATDKIQAAGGSVNVLEVPTESRPALGVAEATASATPADGGRDSAPTEDASVEPAKSSRTKPPKASADAAAGSAAAQKPAKATKAVPADESALAAEHATPVAERADASDPADEAATVDETAPTEPTEAGESVEAVTGDRDASDGSDAADGTDEATTDSSTDESA